MLILEDGPQFRLEKLALLIQRKSPFNYSFSNKSVINYGATDNVFNNF